MISVALARPRLIPLLSASAGVLVAVYVALMIATIIFASLQTQLAQDVQSKHMEIAKLENSYYSSVARLDSTDPRTLGYVKPSHVQYLSEASIPNLTFAGN
ncbi:MAG TPA: hypothetical protein VN086_00710 [Candidatus Paceibacterota bacterium]|nr:hypothetical protein [Candidatus Paceibacterota bacterium]